jgi:NADH-quinone oxidoreductase subunit L
MMLSLLWIIPALPLAGFLSLALSGGRLSRTEVARIGAGSIGLSALTAIAIAIQFLSSPPQGHAYTQRLWTWMHIGDFTSDIAFRLDALSLLMVLVVTIVGFLIHVYSTEYMAHDADFTRFFAYMNLFVAAMLVLVLADNLPFMFLGWEGVGLCSYLLIGFWYSDPKNCRAAIKAFLVTRIGDVAMVIGIFVIYSQLGTVHIGTISQHAAETWQPGSTFAILAALLLLGGAIGKSGQLPLQVWLPDAMAGPTPVSALIHAATMVTAGVYLIARMNVIFALAPSVQYLVAIVGAVTLLIAGLCAMVQRDIKRALAYSTISQIGYMFLALGVGAWSAAMFHFMTHAIFKALLFMAAGAIIVALHHEQDMFKMGGLRHRLPFVFWVFLIGAMSLSALPLVTAGFYSKDLILWEVWASPKGGKLLWFAGCLGAFMTSIYTFRMFFLTFFGNAKTEVYSWPGLAMKGPLLLLAIAATFAGFLQTPSIIGHVSLFSHFLESALPGSPVAHGSVATEFFLMFMSTLAVMLGLAVAYTFYMPKQPRDATPAGTFQLWLATGMGFDTLYDRVLVRPYIALARANKSDAIDDAIKGIVIGADLSARLVQLTQTGRLRWYAAAMGVGAAIGIYMVVYQ